jgi:hypothetical protein
MIDNTYRRAPFYFEVFPIIEELIRYPTDNLSIYLANQVRKLSAFMGIQTDFVETSRCYGNNDLRGIGRVIDICKHEGATIYINPQGGKTLYNKAGFAASNIELHFITMRPIPYKQRAAGFVPYLSIIDALMEVGQAEIKNHLHSFDMD